MNIQRSMAGILAPLVLVTAGMQPVSAELPSLDEQPWLGYYAVVANKRLQFTFAANGKIALTPIGDKGDPVAHTLAIPIEILIEEMTDGKPVAKQIKPETLESPQPATDKLEKVVITGKVTGEAAFEVTLEQARGGISIGGRITDPGTLTKNPLRFGIRAKIPNAYPKANVEEIKDSDKELTKEEKRAERKAKRDAEKDGKGDAKKDAKKDADELEKIKADRIDLKWTDGTRKKQTFEKEVEAASKDLNGPGIAGAEIEISAYQGKKFLFIASPNSAMTLANDKPAPLFQGFSITWAAGRREGQGRQSPPEHRSEVASGGVAEDAIICLSPSDGRRNAGAAMIQNERLRVLGDEFQQLGASPGAGMVGASRSYPIPHRHFPKLFQPGKQVSLPNLAHCHQVPRSASQITRSAAPRHRQSHHAAIISRRCAAGASSCLAASRRGGRQGGRHLAGGSFAAPPVFRPCAGPRIFRHLSPA